MESKSEPCSELGWNPITSAASHSQLAGVVASLVFAGMIVLLTDRGKTVKHTYSLILLTSSFFILALDSFLFGVASGEQICGRAWTSTMVAGGMLGVGAIGIFGGLSWLMTAYGDEDVQGARLTVVIAFVVASVVGLHVWITAVDFAKDMAHFGRVPRWLADVVWVYLAVTALGVLALALLRRLRPRQPSRATVVQAAYATVTYALLCSVTSGLLLGPAVSDWDAVPPWVLSVATLVPLTLVAAAVATQLLALPVWEKGKSSPQETGEAAPPQPFPVPRGPESRGEPSSEPNADHGIADASAADTT